MIDWNAIQTEYITTDTSFRKIAEKYGISYKAITNQSKKNNWVEQKKQYNIEVISESLKKSVDLESDRLAKLRMAGDALVTIIVDLLEDQQQFYRHLLTTTDDLGNPKLTDQVCKKADMVAIKNLTATLKDLTAIMRNLYGLPTIQEQAAMDIAASRLTLDTQKANVGTSDDTETGVVLIAEVLPDEPE